ncbi:U-box domain-containing protein 15-like isoform X1 [Punica granatum]|uniref:RING-type E3 ubiquitin transferase n=2 Tax=Punica granatum TaxID=22663 RepID=A0A6P8CXF7_PUNGR|nr:U-box domain-containing protein 15-like isoform X1 [Punica granatum]
MGSAGEESPGSAIAMVSGSAKNDAGDRVKELIEAIEAAGMFGGYRKTQRKECLSLVRRLKLLVPLLEEIGELRDSGACCDSLSCLADLEGALVSAKKLLKQCSCGSKIYLALENEAVMSRFHAVYDKLNQALDDLPYDELGISVEVREQVELMRMQLKRSKRRTDTLDIELAMDLMVVLSLKDDDRRADNAILERLANKLELRNIRDLRTETLAVRKLTKKRNGQNAENVQQIVGLLGKFKQIVGAEDQSVVIDSSARAKALERCRSLQIPHEFLCPITLEIMTDPVIVATGQTYDRESITRWLDSDHRTCPKTGQVLEHLSMAPNYALRNLISQWCGKNNIDLPKREIHSSSCSLSLDLVDRISSLVQDLSSPQPDTRREAAVKLRVFSKESPENRMLIANGGAVPPLVQLLSFPDPNIQEHAVTALLNLSLNESNKRLIAREGAIPLIIGILESGTQEARENSAAALFSISMLDENKVLIGALNGIPPLVDLLKDGSVRGKKDAATAIFNLSLHHMNKSRAINAGVMKPLIQLLDDRNLGMVDEALSILRLLASHPEGRKQIGRLSVIETLVGIVRNGTPKNKECAASVLLELGMNNSSFLLAALQFGVYEHLVELTRCGTSRAQRKANALLQHMSKCEHIP